MCWSSGYSIENFDTTTSDLPSYKSERNCKCSIRVPGEKHSSKVVVRGA